MLIRFFESALSTEIASLDTTDLVGIISILKDINSIIKIDDTTPSGSFDFDLSYND